MTESEINRWLNTRTFGRVLHLYGKTSSTNTVSRKLVAANAGEGTVVCAEEQTAGRGRLGRHWQSERGKNLTFSIILRPKLKPEYIGTLSLFASLSVAEAIGHLTRLNARVKWPNDVLIYGKKVCGILSEVVFTESALDAVIVGVGVNINQITFPDALDATATSLNRETGGDHDLAAVLASILGSMESRYPLITSGNFQVLIDEWLKRTDFIGTRVDVNQHGTSISGTALSVEVDGGLMIQAGDKTVKVLAGDVTMTGD